MPRNKDGHFYYGWYPTIVKSDTAHLTLSEDGAYRRLIDEYMVSRGALSSDDRALARIIGIGLDEWTAIKSNIIPYFKPSKNPSGYLIHDFCDRELSEDNQRINKARENGRKGGRPKTQEEPSPNPALTRPADSQIKSNQINTSQINKESDPTDSFKFIDNRFDLDGILKDETRDSARRMAPGWDLHVLIGFFNEQVRTGKFNKPQKPDAAFLAWIPKFTRGKRP